MLGTKLLWPGASRMVKCFFSVSKDARPTSTVFPFSRSNNQNYRYSFRISSERIINSLPSWFVSNAQDRYQDSRFFSRASFSYFSKVLLSTIPVKNMIWPPIVDFPASIARIVIYSVVLPVWTSALLRTPDGGQFPGNSTSPGFCSIYMEFYLWWIVLNRWSTTYHMTVDRFFKLSSFNGILLE